MDLSPEKELPEEYANCETRKQYLATFCVLSAQFCGGNIFGWTSPVLPQITMPSNATDDLQLASFTEANLSETNLFEANLSETNVSETNVSNILSIESHLSQELQLSSTESGLVTASIVVGCLFSSALAGFLSDKFGRKRAILIMTPLLMLHWLLIYFAESTAMLCLARFIAGTAIAVIVLAGFTYIGEISIPAIRGRLVSFNEIFHCGGMLFTFVLGSLIPWRNLSLILGFIPLLVFAIFFKMPESPLHLLNKNKCDEALRSLRYFRGKKYNCQKELEQMKQFLNKPLLTCVSKSLSGGVNKSGNRDVEEQLLKESHLVKESQLMEESQLIKKSQLMKESQLIKESQLMKESKSLKMVFQNKGNRKAVVCAVGIIIFHQLSGNNIITFYTGTIFTAAGTSVSADVCVILYGIFQLVVAYGTTFIIDKADRRFYLMVSSVGMCLCHACLGVYFQVQPDNLSYLNYIPVVSVMMFTASNAIGFSPITWVAISELFSPEVKAVGGSISMSTNFIFASIISFSFPIISETLGRHVTFYIFSGFMVGATLFVYFVVPETRGKSLQEIQEILNR